MFSVSMMCVLYPFLELVGCLLDQPPEEVGEVVEGELNLDLVVILLLLLGFVTEPLETLANSLHLVGHDVDRTKLQG